MTQPNSLWAAFAMGQLTGSRQTATPTAPRFNPRPPGVIREGSATHAIVTFLESRPGRYYSESELVRITGKSRSAVTWSLNYLRALGRLESVNQQHPLWLRHGIPKDPAPEPWLERFDPAIKEDADGTPTPNA